MFLCILNLWSVAIESCDVFYNLLVAKGGSRMVVADEKKVEGRGITYGALT